MSARRWRLEQGGTIDRARELSFHFDGRPFGGFEGDTLASALLANGVHLVGRSFKYHRPRGIFAAGAEEPNALVTLEDASRHTPNLRATEIPLHDGLRARSQNRWPSLEHDAGALAGRLAGLFPVGFYYKTFMSPRIMRRHYERWLRRMAGLGEAPAHADPDAYAKRHAHCDVLVVGAGPAGLSAALAAAVSGASVIVAASGSEPGGGLNRLQTDAARAWRETMLRALGQRDNVTLLVRTTAIGWYPHDMVGLVQRAADELAPQRDPSTPREILWHVRARRTILATGAIERPIVFPGNDRPGIMLAAAMRSYVNRHAVRPGERVAVFTTNGTAWDAALDMHDAGVAVDTIVDAREDIDTALLDGARGRNIRVLPGAVVTATQGRRRLRRIEVRSLTGGRAQRLACDALAVSGGWTPTLHLYAQAGGQPVYAPEIGAYAPAGSAATMHVAGAAAGQLTAREALGGALQAARDALAALGRETTVPRMPQPWDHEPPTPPATRVMWRVPARLGRGGFVDLQNDVRDRDIELALQEGYQAIEHVKRYAVVGFGTDQGRTGNINAIGIVSEELGEQVLTAGTTTFRAPYTPVSFGTFAGATRGRLLDPVRRTPMHQRHAATGAVFLHAGLWMRPRFYPAYEDEGAEHAGRREAAHVRTHCGIADISTLGKIELRGPDTATLLDRLYCNNFASLPVGKARYGLMLREDGIILDDGTTSRLGETHYLMTTTTGNAAKVLEHVHYALDILWPALRVRVSAVTDAWAGIALAGRHSREVLSTLLPEEPLDDAFAFMGCRETRWEDAPLRLFRISFSGELAFELQVPARRGTALWDALLEAGEHWRLRAYGLEAMDLLRLEKGHLIVGADIDGRVTPADVGLGRMVSTKKDFIGRAGLARAAFADGARLQLVGLESRNADEAIDAGAQLLEAPWNGHAVEPAGRVTSAGFSPVRERPIALGLLAGGAARHGETLYAVSPLTGSSTGVRVGPPVAVDPQGDRLRGRYE